MRDIPLVLYKNSYNPFNVLVKTCKMKAVSYILVFLINELCNSKDENKTQV